VSECPARQASPSRLPEGRLPAADRVVKVETRVARIAARARVLGRGAAKVITPTRLTMLWWHSAPKRSVRVVAWRDRGVLPDLSPLADPAARQRGRAAWTSLVSDAGVGYSRPSLTELPRG
jgi:hypothetical protein